MITQTFIPKKTTKQITLEYRTLLTQERVSGRGLGFLTDIPNCNQCGKKVNPETVEKTEYGGTFCDWKCHDRYTW
jgi:hypothetical protein